MTICEKLCFLISDRCCVDLGIHPTLYIIFLKSCDKRPFLKVTPHSLAFRESYGKT
jgi:hypothetical protein